VLGYDSAGVVEAVGSQVSLFKTGDEVFYAGATDRPGSNSEYQLVDERIVGPKPKSLSFADAAAMPLTSCHFRKLHPYGFARFSRISA
jgi:NADPH:quinone reductase-like Zn-dependent oxidoreductase